MPDLVRVTLVYDGGSQRELVGAEAARWMEWVNTYIDWDGLPDDGSEGVEPFQWIET